MMTRRLFLALSLGCSLFLLLGADWRDSAAPLAARDVAGTGPLRVLIVTGQNNHDCAFTSRLVRDVLVKTGRFRVDLTDDPAKTLADAEAIARYDCFFLDYNGDRWGAAAEKNFLAAVRGGTGVVVMHAANNAFPGWVEYETMVGHLWRKGTGHGRFHRFDVRVDDANHPITWGLPDLKDHPDELYHRLVHMHGAKFRQLMSAHSAKESGGTGKREPMAMILEYGKGRIFHTPLGHVWRGAEATRFSLRDPQLQCLLARGTEWAATGAVTLTPESFGSKARIDFGRAVKEFRYERDASSLPPAAEQIRLKSDFELTQVIDPARNIFVNLLDSDGEPWSPVSRFALFGGWQLRAANGHTASPKVSALSVDGVTKASGVINGTLRIKFNLDVSALDGLTTRGRSPDKPLRSFSVVETRRVVPQQDGIQIERVFAVEGLRADERLELQSRHPKFRSDLVLDAASVTQIIKLPLKSGL
jgi:uncharacterized protein